MIVYKQGCERERRVGRCRGVALLHFDWLVITAFSPEASKNPSLPPSLALFLHMPTSACAPNLSKQDLLAFSVSPCTFFSHVHGAHIDPACLRSLPDTPPLLVSSSSLSTSLLPLLAPTAFLSSLCLAQHLLVSPAVADITASLSRASI